MLTVIREGSKAAIALKAIAMLAVLEGAGAVPIKTLVIETPGIVLIGV